ncbi:hypothetical protein VCHA39O220_80063 [Vibrio chagasii]|nr:hypothetical protein VCHA39O220_80063 [Vibrio chagasii]CAH7481189.1 hypothetical protein VCHA39O224_70063 [Vibrio chagasii]
MTETVLILTAKFENKKAETASFCFILIYVIPFRLINNRSEFVDGSSE